MEGSLVAYKVFTNGSVLQASEINDNLMRQSVMVFANAAARTAAITVPLEGMLTWLEDVNRYESYNGTAWVSPIGSTPIVSVNFSAQTQVLMDNIFTSTIDAYEVYVTAVSSTTAALAYQFRKAGSNIATSTYNHQFTEAQGGSPFSAQYLNQTVALSGNVRTSPGRAMSTMAIMNPMNGTTTTSYQVNHFDNIVSTGLVWGQNYTVDAFDGLRLFIGSGTMTGNVSVYGMRK
jgi:hypothetical protein